MILLDTCSLLWLIGNPSQLSTSATEAIADPHNQFFASSISAFEIGQKAALGKLTLHLESSKWWAEAMHQIQAQELTLTSAIALRAASLPRLHSDPFDRLLIATALEHRLTLLTPDPKIQAYPRLKTLW